MLVSTPAVGKGPVQVGKGVFMTFVGAFHVPALAPVYRFDEQCTQLSDPSQSNTYLAAEPKICWNLLGLRVIGPPSGGYTSRPGLSFLLGKKNAFC